MHADLPNREMSGYVQLIPAVGECVVPRDRWSVAIRTPKGNATVSSIMVDESSHGTSLPPSKILNLPFKIVSPWLDIREINRRERGKKATVARKFHGYGFCNPAPW
jgi:hypothetical protein